MYNYNIIYLNCHNVSKEIIEYYNILEYSHIYKPKGIEMKKIIISFICAITFAGCSGLNYHEQNQIRQLQEQGVTVDRPVGSYEKPASGVAAAALNLLPGFGNFYLGTGAGAESIHILYGALNLLFWPLAIIWSVPEAAIDAENINKREMLYYYTYNEKGKQELKQAGITLSK